MTNSTQQQSEIVPRPGTDAQKQVYDNVFKRLIEGQFEEIIPLLFSELDPLVRRIRMYDPLLEEDPWVQEYGGRQKAAGVAEGEARGIRLSIEMVVQTRFPALYDLAMERLERIHDPLALQRVLVAMSAAQSERKARHYLQTLLDEK